MMDSDPDADRATLEEAATQTRETLEELRALTVSRDEGRLRVVVAGGTVLDPRVVAQLFARRRRDDPVQTLSPREREVLGLIAEGHSNTAIARQLVVTPGVVEKHTQHIFAKLGLAPDEDQHRRVLATLAYLRS